MSSNGGAKGVAPAALTVVEVGDVTPSWETIGVKARCIALLGGAKTKKRVTVPFTAMATTTHTRSGGKAYPKKTGCALFGLLPPPHTHCCPTPHVVHGAGRQFSSCVSSCTRTLFRVFPRAFSVYEPCLCGTHPCNVRVTM